jgi:hypothetical protein
VSIIPWRVDATPVTNYGRTYEVPTSHLGTTLPDISLLTLGRAGLVYYQTLVSDAEGFFVK